MYQLTNSESVVRIADGAFIPNDPANRDRAEYEAWLAAGGVPEPFAAPMPTQADYAAAIELHLNAVAAARGYTNMARCITYLNSTVPQWAAEAAVANAWRDAVWVYAYAQLASPPDPQPSPAEFVALLPAITWP